MKVTNKEMKKFLNDVKDSLHQMPEAHAKYILEQYLGHPALKFGESPDLRCETESIGVEVTCRNENEFTGWLRDIANGKVFTGKADEAKKNLLDYFIRVKQGYLYRYTGLLSESCWNTLSNWEKEYWTSQIRDVMCVEASFFAMSGSDSVKFIKNALAKAVEKNE